MSLISCSDTGTYEATVATRRHVRIVRIIGLPTKPHRRMSQLAGMCG